ncbi:unnamed protein product [Dracunculus medinensis]|uniref:Cytochrome c oxidase subunit 1 n=1 Tax=Dracunculus medinensis TaxID=318479 RepID=A0A0N4URY9_DRAME|nr:unnamed protein product [Dracunculus medinensis]
MKIALIGCAIWAHHIYTVGKNSCAYFAATIVIAVPIGAKVFTWLTTFMRKRSSFSGEKNSSN